MSLAYDVRMVEAFEALEDVDEDFDERNEEELLIATLPSEGRWVMRTIAAPYRDAVQSPRAKILRHVSADVTHASMRRLELTRSGRLVSPETSARGWETRRKRARGQQLWE